MSLFSTIKAPKQTARRDKHKTIIEISALQATSLIESGEPCGEYRPFGLYLVMPLFRRELLSNKFIGTWEGIDNSTGRAFVESWPTRELCEMWLRGEIEPPHLSHQGEFPQMEKLMRAAGVEPVFGDHKPNMCRITFFELQNNDLSDGRLRLIEQLTGEDLPHASASIWALFAETTGCDEIPSNYLYHREVNI